MSILCVDSHEEDEVVLAPAPRNAEGGGRLINVVGPGPAQRIGVIGVHVQRLVLFGDSEDRSTVHFLRFFFCTETVHGMDQFQRVPPVRLCTHVKKYCHICSFSNMLISLKR